MRKRAAVAVAAILALSAGLVACSPSESTKCETKPKAAGAMPVIVPRPVIIPPRPVIPVKPVTPPKVTTPSVTTPSVNSGVSPWLPFWLLSGGASGGGCK